MDALMIQKYETVSSQFLPRILQRHIAILGLIIQQNQACIGLQSENNYLPIAIQLKDGLVSYVVLNKHPLIVLCSCSSDTVASYFVYASSNRAVAQAIYDVFEKANGNFISAE